MKGGENAMAMPTMPVSAGKLDDFLTADEGESFDLPGLIHPPVKSAQTRLLDMLTGWWRYIESDDTPDDADMRQKVFDLYQEVGASDFDENAVRTFVRERLTKTLFG